ncbi:MAG: hypothetical protein Q4C30_07075 [Bacteroidia bacterium]|nr:hypothetical protein [Bacteroidia bacterium]
MSNRAEIVYGFLWSVYGDMVCAGDIMVEALVGSYERAIEENNKVLLRVIIEGQRCMLENEDMKERGLFDMLCDNRAAIYDRVYDDFCGLLRRRIGSLNEVADIIDEAPSNDAPMNKEMIEYEERASRFDYFTDEEFYTSLRRLRKQVVFQRAYVVPGFVSLRPEFEECYYKGKGKVDDILDDREAKDSDYEYYTRCLRDLARRLDDVVKAIEGAES